VDLSSLPARRLARPKAQLRAGRRDWYRITNSADGTSAEVAIYDEIGYFGVTAQDFIRELAAVEADRLDVRLNTPGGEVFDGVAIYNALRNHPAMVTTYVDGLAASIGSVILQAGDQRVAAKASQVMIHDGHGVVIGNAADMRQTADLLDQVSQMIAEVYADRSGGSVEDFRAAMLAETWYTGDEAKSAGLVDEVATAGTSPADNSWDLSVFAHAGRAHAPAPVIPKHSGVERVDVAATISALRGAFA
jgi:ATP-dependent Clp endopeptidase proteolytic subunit ClpP